MIKSLMIVAVVAMAGCFYVGTANANTGCFRDAAESGSCIVELEDGTLVHFNETEGRACKKKEVTTSDCGAEPAAPEALDDMTCEETIHVRGDGSTFTTVRFKRGDTRA